IPRSKPSRTDEALASLGPALDPERRYRGTNGDATRGLSDALAGPSPDAAGNVLGGNPSGLRSAVRSSRDDDHGLRDGRHGARVAGSRVGVVLGVLGIPRTTVRMEHVAGDDPCHPPR